jgi:hypothetical protein
MTYAEEQECKREAVELYREDYEIARAQFLIELRWNIENKIVTLPAELATLFRDMEEVRLQYHHLRPAVR